MSQSLPTPKPQPKECCGTCNAGLKVQGHILCRAHPPTVIIVNNVNPLTGQAEHGTAAQFPPMQEQGWCREWQPAAAAVDLREVRRSLEAAFGTANGEDLQ
jgi:hypothetical protein